MAKTIIKKKKIKQNKQDETKQLEMQFKKNKTNTKRKQKCIQI